MIVMITQERLKQLHLGTFNDPITASAAYKAAKQIHQPLQEVS